MEKKLIDFTNEDKYIIAEFVYSNITDVLIKPDAISLVDVLAKHEMIDRVDDWKKDINNNVGGVVRRLTKVLGDNISDKQGNSIMKAYYNGELTANM